MGWRNSERDSTVESSRIKRIEFTLVALLAFGATENAVGQEGAPYKPGVVVVRLKSHETVLKKSGSTVLSGVGRLDAALQRRGILEARPLFPPDNADQNLRVRLGLDRTYALQFPPEEDVPTIVVELSQIQDVEYAEPDFIGQGGGVAGQEPLVPNDSYFERQWAFRNTGSNVSWYPGKQGADIRATSAWSICTGDTNVIVAVLDTGLKWDHPDIASRVWINKREITANGIDDDQNGLVDDVRGWNFSYGNNNVADDFGHGTNTASIIGAASNNRLGYAGLDWGCRIMVVKELDSTNRGLYSAWASSLYYAANNGARIINMSEGGTGTSQTLKAAIDYAYGRGCFIAAAMMNTNDSTRYYPAGFDDHVIAVGATDSFDKRCSPFVWGGGSNYGPWIDFVAPGNVIFGLNNKSDTDYGWYWSGTSQATPMVAGLAALLLAQSPSRSPSTLREIIAATTDDTLGTGNKPFYDVYYGCGRINCYRALAYSPTGIAREARVFPTCYVLRQNYPNPFNPSTDIQFEIPEETYVSLSIYNLLGQRVATLVSERLTGGSYTSHWSSANVPSGIYFYRLETYRFIETKRLIVLR